MNVLTADYTAVDRDRTIWVRSLRDTGFALLVNTPLDHSQLARLYAEWAEFFAQDEKFDYPCDPDLPEGYFPFRTEAGRLIDSKESFYFRPGGPCPEQLRPLTELVHGTLFSIARNLLDGLAESPDPNAAAFLKTGLDNSPRHAALRIIHYPPLASFPEVQVGQNGLGVRLTTHRDLNLLTILPAATVPGLEILDNEGNWHRIACDRGATVVNTGDQLQRLSGGFYKATQHRVCSSIAEFASPRYAAALFLG